MPVSSFKEYWKRELSLDALRLEHHNRRDFYVSCWQQGTSPLPLLILRTLQFITVLAIWLGSLVQFDVSKAMWFIYLTHWGLTLLLAMTCVGASISAVAFFRKIPDGSLGISWQEKTYWVLYNMGVPIAFLITVFYWSVLYVAPDESMEDYDPQLPLDVSIHGLNSAIALSELMSSSLPSRLLHLPHPLAFAFAYMLFGVVYHLAGGVNRTGDPWVYSVIDWAHPGPTLGMVLGTGLLLSLLHALVVATAAGRSILAGTIVPDHTAPEGTSGGRYRWRQRDTAAVEM